MTERVGRFTRNKQVVRDLQLECIKSVFPDKLGNLRYFGLCSPEMKDVIDWASLLAQVVAVERGEAGKEYEDQHKLRLTATRHGFQSKLRLLCGDIDHVVLNGGDEYGNHVAYPFDIASFDYSGGLFYKDEKGFFYRLGALKKVIEEQSKFRGTYVLFVSANCHAVDAGEVRTAIQDLRVDLRRHGWNADHVCDAYLEHPDDRARLRLYVPLFVGQEAGACSYRPETKHVIIYEGNNGEPMLNFRFVLRPCRPTAMRRLPRERISQILNSPCIRIADGKKRRTMLGLPKLTAADAGQSFEDASS